MIGGCYLSSREGNGEGVDGEGVDGEGVDGEGVDGEGVDDRVGEWVIYSSWEADCME